MKPDSGTLYLLLLLAQAAHATEETLGHLWDSIIPARRIALSLSSDPATGFVIFNIGLLLFGLACYVIWIRPRRTGAGACIALWVIIGLFNGVAHSLLAWWTHGAVPGYYTAPVMMVIAICLAWVWSGEAIGEPDRNRP